MAQPVSGDLECHLYGAAGVARADLPPSAADDAASQSVVQAKWVANGKHFLTNQQPSRVTQLGGMQQWLQAAGTSLSPSPSRQAACVIMSQDQSGLFGCLHLKGQCPYTCCKESDVLEQNVGSVQTTMPWHAEMCAAPEALLAMQLQPQRASQKRDAGGHVCTIVSTACCAA